MYMELESKPNCLKPFIATSGMLPSLGHKIPLWMWKCVIFVRGEGNLFRCFPRRDYYDWSVHSPCWTESTFERLVFIVPAWPLSMPSLGGVLCDSVCSTWVEVSIRVRTTSLVNPLITVWLCFLSTDCPMTLRVQILIFYSSVFVSNVCTKTAQLLNPPRFHYFSFLNFRIIDVQILEYMSYFCQSIWRATSHGSRIDLKFGY